MITTLTLTLSVFGAQPAVLTDWPPYITNKNLYAKNDYRGKKAPELAVEKWLTGNPPDIKNKLVLVDIWATWCGPCRELIPELNEWKEKFKKDLVVIGISDESEQTVAEFMTSTPMRYNVAIDTKKRVMNALGVQGIPHVIVISKDGIVRYQGWPQDEKDRLTTEKLAQMIAANNALK